MTLSSVDVETYLQELEGKLTAATSLETFYDMVVNAPFENRLHPTTFGIGFMTLCLANRKNNTVDRIRMTDNYLAQGARSVTVVPFEKLIVPYDAKGNCVVEAIRSGRYQQTNDWNNLLTPVLKPEEARLNQAGAGIASSFVYPLPNFQPGGAIIFQYFITLDKIGKEQHDFMFRYSKLVAKSLNSLHKG